MLMKLLGGFPLTDLAGLRFGFRCVPSFHKIEAWQTFRSESGFDSKLLAFGLKALGRSQDWSACMVFLGPADCSSTDLCLQN